MRGKQPAPGPPFEHLGRDIGLASSIIVATALVHPMVLPVVREHPRFAAIMVTLVLVVLVGVTVTAARGLLTLMGKRCLDRF